MCHLTYYCYFDLATGLVVIKLSLILLWLILFDLLEYNKISLKFLLFQVGAAISMTYITGQPIVFVGTGQTYTDLKALNVKAVVHSLMK